MPRTAALPRLYWMTWLFLTLSIAAAFSFVIWGSQVVADRTGITDVEATRLASLFVLGVLTGRIVLSMGFGDGLRSVVVLRGCAALAVVGAAVTLLATQPALSGLGLLLGGLGISAIYPLAASLAIAHAPGVPVRASARLTAASGISILVAPLALGLVAGAVGLAGAWIIVLGVLGVGLLLIMRIPAPLTPPTSSRSCRPPDRPRPRSAYWHPSRRAYDGRCSLADAQSTDDRKPRCDLVSSPP